MRESFRYIIVGGGTAGCALASRLQERLAVPNGVLIVDRGLKQYDHEWIQNPLLTPRLKGSELQTHYRTVPQTTLASRTIVNIAGNVLSGMLSDLLHGSCALLTTAGRFFGGELWVLDSWSSNRL